jgi:HD-GYP domain-containing protein (c-di-GMP phosphodiesterase class II)
VAEVFRHIGGLNHEQEREILERLDLLNQIGVALSSERDLMKLMEHILEAARDFANADGGTLYRVQDGMLTFEALRNNSLGLRMGGRSGNKIDFKPIPMRMPDGSDNDTMVVVRAALSGKTVNIPDAYATEDFDFSGTRAFDATTGYHSQSFLTVPMKDHTGAVIGVLQLINAKDKDGNVQAFPHADQQLVESLASQAAIAYNNRLLVEQLENLFESLISLINFALDEKSPYTGGHCDRVPVLTMMLAEAASRVTDGPLADFVMSEKDRYELRIAGLLHDCGKITTPVHVVDKATKLHTLFDRLELLDARFEVLLRDAEIARLRGELDQDAHTRLVAGIEADRALVHRSNTGGEFMDDTQVAAIHELARRELRGADGSVKPFLSADEIENLCIRRGTLTAAEREIINHHIVMTIRMLEALPWPSHLTQVPEYAGGHHERMDGKGYPKGLTREQMSVPARVMGIADVFEALTAKDRPYKKGMTLTQSLKILGRMRLDNHVDPDLFEVFLRERVYREYAERFLDAHQIDKIDWNEIPGVSPELAAHLIATEQPK